VRRRPPAACQRIAASRSRARLGRCEANGNTAPPAAPTAKVNVEVFYVHPDHLGTPRVITASTALVATTGTGITSAQIVNKAVWRWDSDPFGSNATANSAPNENPNTLSQVVGTATVPYLFGFDLAFPGQKRDRESGKHYNYFRDYDPAVGRYVESDPIGLKGGISTFGYVLASPLKFSDARGLIVYICLRAAFRDIGGIGNHYYYWNSVTNLPCGRTGGDPFSSEKGPPSDACWPISGSDGQEEKLMTCCNRRQSEGLYVPGINDCKSTVVDCVIESKLTVPPIPGRLSTNCSSCYKGVEPRGGNY